MADRPGRPYHLALALAVPLAAACVSNGSAAAGGGDGGVTVAVSGPEGEPLAATNVADVLVVPLGVDGTEGTAVVDTGSPIVALDPSAFGATTLPDGAGTVSTLTLGALTFARQYVVGANLLSSPDPTVAIGGSLGCDILCAFALSLDYRGSTVTLGASRPPSGVASPGASLPFTLGGGGTVGLTGVPGSVDFPASRIVVLATIEGQARTMVVDTGNSFVTLRSTIWSGLVADGRGEITGVGTASQSQESSSGVARLRSVVVGGEEVTGLVGSSDPAIDATLDGVAAEIGASIDGLVGGSFLRQFYVTVDYPARVLHLRRYTVGGPTFDTFDRLGFAVAPAKAGGPSTVAAVLGGTDAARQGVAVGDVVVSVDGHPLAPLGETAIGVLVSGVVGSTKAVTFGAAKSASLSGQTVSIAVDDLLPL